MEVRDAGAIEDGILKAAARLLPQGPVLHRRAGAASYRGSASPNHRKSNGLTSRCRSN